MPSVESFSFLAAKVNAQRGRTVRGPASINRNVILGLFPKVKPLEDPSHTRNNIAGINKIAVSIIKPGMDPISACFLITP
jgi:hypothetical protein